MARTVKEWIGKTDDAPPSEACKRRILAKQDGKCALTGKSFTPKDKPQFDHIVPLWLGGENRESNLQAILGEPHKRKTSAEATVRAKVNANQSKHLGLSNRQKKKIDSRPKAAPKPTRIDKSAIPPLPVNNLYRSAT